MKILNGMVKKLLILIWLAASVALFGAAGRSSVFSRIKVDVKLEKPPIPSVNGSPHAAPHVIADPQWLVVRVTFHPQIPKDDGPNYVTYIDGVRMSIRALFPLTRSSSDHFGMFKGEQTLWTVCCDGKTHTAMMLIPPHLLQRYVYLADSFSGTRIPLRGSFRIEVVFTDGAGHELGRGYYGVSGNAAKQGESFGRLETQVLEQCVVDGAFFERDATPWRCMAPDQFDLVKPAGVKLTDVPTPPRGNGVVRIPGKGTLPRSGVIPPAKK